MNRDLIYRLIDISDTIDAIEHEQTGCSMEFHAKVKLVIADTIKALESIELSANNNHNIVVCGNGKIHHTVMSESLHIVATAHERLNEMSTKDNRIIGVCGNEIYHNDISESLSTSDINPEMLNKLSTYKITPSPIIECSMNNFKDGKQLRRERRKKERKSIK